MRDSKYAVNNSGSIKPDDDFQPEKRDQRQREEGDVDASVQSDVAANDRRQRAREQDGDEDDRDFENQNDDARIHESP